MDFSNMTLEEIAEAQEKLAEAQAAAKQEQIDEVEAAIEDLEEQLTVKKEELAALVGKPQRKRARNAKSGRKYIIAALEKGPADAATLTERMQAAGWQTESERAHVIVYQTAYGMTRVDEPIIKYEDKKFSLV